MAWPKPTGGHRCLRPEVVRFFANNEQTGRLQPRDGALDEHERVQHCDRDAFGIAGAPTRDEVIVPGGRNKRWNGVEMRAEEDRGVDVPDE